MPDLSYFKRKTKEYHADFMINDAYWANVDNGIEWIRYDIEQWNKHNADEPERQFTQEESENIIKEYRRIKQEAFERLR